MTNNNFGNKYFEAEFQRLDKECLSFLEQEHPSLKGYIATALRERAGIAFSAIDGGIIGLRNGCQIIKEGTPDGMLSASTLEKAPFAHTLLKEYEKAQPTYEKLKLFNIDLARQLEQEVEKISHGLKNFLALRRDFAPFALKSLISLPENRNKIFKTCAPTYEHGEQVLKGLTTLQTGSLYAFHTTAWAIEQVIRDKIQTCQPYGKFQDALDAMLENVKVLPTENAIHAFATTRHDYDKKRLEEIYK